MTDPALVTRLLQDLAAGDEQASHLLVPLVYEELRVLAARALRSERSDHTLQATALVHEAWERLAGSRVRAQSRGHFLGIAARVMRQVLVDHARRHAATKRGGELQRVTFDEGALGTAANLELMALHEALEGLEHTDPQSARVAEARLFGGLTVPETAEALGVSPRTVDDEWAFARMWLARALA